MKRPRSREGEGPSGLHLERVDLVPTELGVVLVRVSGRWDGDPAPGPVVLQLGERAFEPLPETSSAAARAAAENAFRATFSIGDELRPALDAEDMRLEAGGQSFELPVARDSATGVASPAGAQVVDRAELAERRARRAEAAEQALANRAEEAERALATLEGDLGKLELRLERALDERSELRSAVAEAVREAREAGQREEAERRRREEAVAEATERADEAEAQAARLEERASVAAEQAGNLDREAETLRRRVAEAEHAAVAAEAARAKAEEAVAQAPAPAETAPPQTEPAPPAPAPAPAPRAAGLAAERALAQQALRVRPPAPRPRPSADLSGLSNLLAAERRASAAHRGAAVGRGLHDESRHAAAAVADAAWSLAEARDAVAGVTGAVETERSLRATVESERKVLSTELAAERERGTQVRTELREAHARAQKADEAEAALREYSAAAGEALEEAERRIGEAREAATGMRDRLEEERRERERAERSLREEIAQQLEAATTQVRTELEAQILSLAADLQAEREARARAEEALAVAPPAQAPPEVEAPVEPPVEVPAPEAAPRPAPKPEPRPKRAEERQEPWLPRALGALAAEDPGSALRLAVQLLPAQGLGAEAPLDYDLLAEGIGWQGVALRQGRGTVASLPKPRPRRRTDFRIALDAPALAELLAGGGTRAVRKAGDVRIRGTLRRRHALKRLPQARLDLADLAEAGIWPDPGLVLTALFRLADPKWMEGEPLLVALEISGPRGGRWTVLAGGVEPIVVATGRPNNPNATVRMPQGAFQALLAGRPGQSEAKAAIRGDVAALSRLVGWIERAQREPA